MLNSFNRSTFLLEHFPIFTWLKTYTRQDATDDVFAGVITAILLVPQGIAYAVLAGLPPQLGLYASILPPVVYALLGTSRALSVGPVSIAAIMIAGVLAEPEIQALNQPVVSALVLSALSGVIMLFMAMLKLGGLVNFISHPVLAGFTSGAAILIILSQLPAMAGLPAPQCGFNVACYADYASTANPYSLFIAAMALAVLVIFTKPLPWLLKKLQVKTAWVTAISKGGPLLTVVISAVLAQQFGQAHHVVAVVGKIPAGLPEFQLNFLNWPLAHLLLPYATFIALIAYIESVAIAKVTANLRGQKIVPNQELIALGLANLAAATTGGMPVAGGFSRTMVNYSAGAKTQMAMLIAAGCLALSVIFFSTWFQAIPKAALAAIILIAVYRLVRIRHIFHTWNYDKADGLAEAATLLGVLILGIEEGIGFGIVLTIASQLRKASHPHIAIVGRVPDTEHYRNIKRHSVETWHHLLLVRIDESITFANISYIEEFLEAELRRQPNTKHVILIFTSVSDIDTTALEALEMFNDTLRLTGRTLNIAEAKGPVLDKLSKTDFVEQLKPGRVYFRTEEAVRALG